MAGYLGASPVPQTIQKKQSFTATASQTTFTTTGYTDGNFINVFLNGVRLVNGTDYTATNGSDIVLTTGASASDVLDFETFNEFTLVDQTLETPTFRTSATLKNDTHEDTDGGRESTLIFKGEQSGGEISTLAEIEASHDGTSDDEKGDLIFRTNDGSDGSSPTEAMRVSSDQRVHVGGSTDVTTAVTGDNVAPKLLVEHTTATSLGVLRQDTSIASGNSLGSLGFYGTDTTSNTPTPLAAVQAVASGTHAAGDNPTDLRFFTTPDGSATLTERWRITQDGHLKAMSSGLGIDFSATADASGANGGTFTSISEVLDDYEEGIAEITITTGGGSITLASNGNGAYYTKIGRLVTIGARLDVASVSSPSGQLYITGLPFAGLFDHDTAGQNAVTVIIFSPSVNLEYNLCGEITNTHTTSILLRDKMGFTGGVAAVADHIDAGSLLAFTATYVAA